MRPGPVTTPTREALIRLAQDAFAREHLEYLSLVAEPHRRVMAERARLKAARATLAWEKSVFDQEPAVLGEPEVSRRRLGEEHHPETVIVRRRRTEHRKLRARAHADVARAQADVTAIEADLARAEQEAKQQHQAVIERVVRIHEYIHRRLAVYRRALVRFHPEGAWVNWALSVTAPEIPTWALPDAHLPEPVTRQPPPYAKAEPPGEPEELARKIPLLHETTRFGSAEPDPSTSDVGYVKLDSALAAPWHFTIVKVADGLELRTRGNDHGPYIDGEQVSTAILHAHDYFDFADRRYTMQSRDQLLDEPLGKPSLIVADLNAKTDSKPRLSRMSFVQQERTLLAVLGPSGAGKSSLCYALLGELPLESGRLFFREMAMATHSRQIRDQLGFVPQETKLHMSLTVQDTLRYGFSLRSARKQDREDRIDHVLAATDLKKQQNQLLCTLSGGQLRRVSIALELLTDPPLLMLDEPTSGLDASMDRQIMQILRDYAENERANSGHTENDHTVVVVTHSTENLPQAHQIVVVVEGGAPAYSGPPRQIRKHFGFKTYADLMSMLLAEPRKWADHYRTDGTGNQAVQEADQLEQQIANQPAHASPSRKATNRSLRAARRQFRVLVRRQCALVLTRALKENDRTWWHWVKNGLVVALPLLIAVGAAGLAALVAGAPGLGPVPSVNGPTALALLTTLCVLSGQALTYSDVVSELDIIKREYRAGVGVFPVLTAKWLVFAALAVAQAGLITVVFCLVPNRAPGRSVMFGPATDLFIGLAALSVAAMTLGILVSALATKLEHAVALITATSIAQIALNGVTSALSTTSVSSVLAALLPDRWGVAAVASSIDLLGFEPRTQVSNDALWAHSTGQWLQDLAALATLSVVFFALAAWRLHARLEPKS
jgi:ABC transport system ATP-binding/permease protein